MTKRRTVDAVDVALLNALIAHPDSTNSAISETTGLARNTVRARRARYTEEGILRSFERRIDPSFLGYPLNAYIQTKVKQRKLDAVGQALAEIPEVLEVQGISGAYDLLVLVTARDAEDLYRIAGRVLSIEGVKRTDTGLVMRELVRYRIRQLLQQKRES